MKVRADLHQSVSVDVDALEWVPSPTAGVDRRMLDRIGDEVARATTVVRYAEGSAFPSHTHGMGEEFFVLEGVFEDEHGAYPPGTYIRNPWGTSHAPASKSGCTIFVKLRQMDAEDQTRVVEQMDAVTVEPTLDPGVQAGLLHHYGPEEVFVERWSPGASATRTFPGGAELFVLDGAFEDELGVHTAPAWVRLAPGTRHVAKTAEGCKLWVKRGHLSDPLPRPA